MNEITFNKNLSIIFIFLIVLLLSFSLSPFIIAEENSSKIEDNEDIKNPFSDYRNNENEKKESVSVFKEKKEKSEDIIKIENQRQEPSFLWKGLISGNERYNVLIIYNNKSHLLHKGESLNGYKIIDIAVDKITLKKDGFIYYLEMGRE